jgi:alpha-1,3-rhamnosyl/mannosyltransferase
VTAAQLHVCVDATSWPNDRGFGRFTRELVKALLARDEGFQYTLLFDQRPAEVIPPGVRVLSAQTERSLSDSAVGKTSRSPA